jgi:hypothetical protein
MGPYLSDDLWKVIEKCWHQEPKDRPSMKHVLGHFTSLSPTLTKHGITPHLEQGRFKPGAHREIQPPLQHPQPRAEGSKPQHRLRKGAYTTTSPSKQPRAEGKAPFANPPLPRGNSARGSVHHSSSLPAAPPAATASSTAPFSQIDTLQGSRCEQRWSLN